MAVVLPLGFGLALVAEELVQLLLGPRWNATIPILQVLVPVFSLRSVTAVTDSVVMALGTTRLLFYRACVMIFVRVGLITTGLAYFGLMGAVYGWALSSLLAVALQLQLLRHMLDVPFFMPVARAWRTWIALATMVLGLMLLPRVFGGPTSLAISLLVKILAGGVIYCSTHALLWLLVGQPRGAETRILSLMRTWKEASRRILVKGNRWIT
jgi:PST family polysaccharide transporter